MPNRPSKQRGQIAPDLWCALLDSIESAMKSYVLLYDPLAGITKWKELRNLVRKFLYITYGLVACAIICTITVLVIESTQSDEIRHTGELTYMARIDFLSTSKPTNGVLVLFLKFDYEYFEYQANITEKRDESFIEVTFVNPHSLSELHGPSIRLNLLTDDPDPNLTVIKFTITMITGTEKSLEFCPKPARLKNDQPINLGEKCSK